MARYQVTFVVPNREVVVKVNAFDFESAVDGAVAKLADTNIERDMRRAVTRLED